MTWSLQKYTSPKRLINHPWECTALAVLEFGNKDSNIKADSVGGRGWVCRASSIQGKKEKSHSDHREKPLGRGGFCVREPGRKWGGSYLTGPSAKHVGDEGGIGSDQKIDFLMSKQSVVLLPGRNPGGFQCPQSQVSTFTFGADRLNVLGEISFAAIHLLMQHMKEASSFLCWQLPFLRLLW